MINKILIFFSDIFLNLLSKRNVNLFYVISKYGYYNVFQMIKAVTDLSVKRADIIDAQTDLLKFSETCLMDLLAKEEDGWKKTYIINNWVDKIEGINKLVEEHKILNAAIDELYTEINKQSK